MTTRTPARARRGLPGRALPALLAGALLLAGCGDSGPEGPGALSATVQGPGPLGAAVVEVTGRGITGFEGAGSSRTFDAATAPGVYRVVVVATTAGELDFRIQVEDRSAPPPTALVVSAVDGSNVPFATVASGFAVAVSR